MKKLVLILSLCTTILFSQRDKELNVSLSERAVFPSLENNLAPNDCNDTLSTPLLAGNGNDGIMFDIVANSPILVKSISNSFDIGAATMVDVEIYTKTGTHVGSESSVAAWTLHGRGYVHVSSTAPIEIPIGIYRNLAVGETLGVYINIKGGNGLNYTDGTGVGNIITQNSSLKILEGTGKSIDFGSNFSPRNFNGFVNYCPQLVCNTTTIDTTSYSSNNGNDGSMFEITALQDFTIKKLYQNCNGTGPLMVYYKMGSYVGFETSSSSWILLDSISSVTSAGSDQATEIPLPLYMNVDAGQTVSFYITGTGNGLDVNYFDGTTEGAIYENYGAFVIKEGKGVSFPFAGNFSPRVWSGSIEYCNQGFVGIENNDKDIRVNVFPNPTTTILNFYGEQLNQLENVTLEFFDIQGKLVSNYVLPTSTQHQIDVNSLTNGVYIYKLKSNKEIITIGNFVKQ